MPKLTYNKIISWHSKQTPLTSQIFEAFRKGSIEENKISKWCFHGSAEEERMYLTLSRYYTTRITSIGNNELFVSNYCNTRCASWSRSIKIRVRALVCNQTKFHLELHMSNRNLMNHIKASYISYCLKN